MSAILTIDQGNTAIKVKVFAGCDEPVEACVMSELELDILSRLISDHDIRVAAWCSVTHTDPRMVESLRLMLRDRLLLLTHDTAVPIQVSYRTPRSLGADRVAAVCGAVALYPGQPLLIVDAGTAITIDYVDSEANFLGGNISAGVEMRLHALNAYTAALPKISSVGELPEFGLDTATALRCGALRGAAAEIDSAFAVAKDLGENVALILTGGDAPLIAPLLNNKETICHPDLVSHGLISILKYNEYI